MYNFNINFQSFISFKENKKKKKRYKSHWQANNQQFLTKSTKVYNNYSLVWTMRIKMEWNQEEREQHEKQQVEEINQHARNKHGWPWYFHWELIQSRSLNNASGLKRSFSYKGPELTNEMGIWMTITKCKKLVMTKRQNHLHISQAFKS